MCKVGLIHHWAPQPCCDLSDFHTERKRLVRLYKVRFTQDLSKRCECPNSGIDLLEFMKIAGLPGLLGDQFFAALDADRDGLLGCEDFVDGILKLFCGAHKETSQLVFDVMDFGRKGYITLDDMHTVLLHLPRVCPRCEEPVPRKWDAEEEVESCFGSSYSLDLSQASDLMTSHELLWNAVLEALICSLPVAFDQLLGNEFRPYCEPKRDLIQPRFLKPLRFDLRRRLYEVRGGALLGYNCADSKSLKSVTLLQGLFVSPVGQVSFKLTGSRVVYEFEADCEEDRDLWVEAIVSEKRYRWFDDYYEIHEKLGSGAYGQVYKAKSRQSGVFFAVKIVAKGSLTAKLEERLYREIRVLEFVSHPNILKLIEFFETQERMYIVTELLSGGTLFESLEGRNFTVSEEFAKTVVRDVAAGLSCLHENRIVHRDLKLENIMLHKDSSGERCVLIDFGLSCFLGPCQSSSDSVGTLKYVAPEIIAQLKYAEKVDSWSLGVVLYVLLSGRLPFYGKTEQEVAVRVLKRRLKFCGDRWQEVSGSAIEALSNLLCRKAESRWSLAALHRSSWLSPQPSVHFPANP